MDLDHTVPGSPYRDRDADDHLYRNIPCDICPRSPHVQGREPDIMEDEGLDFVMALETRDLGVCMSSHDHAPATRGHWPFRIRRNASCLLL